MYNFSSFVAVNSGYEKKKDYVSDIYEAQRIIDDALSGCIENTYQIFPALVVWSKKRGCHSGGSPCGFVVVQDGPIEKVFSDLKEKLRLMTVGVTSVDRMTGQDTVTYSADLGNADIYDCARVWQTEMDKVFVSSGMEISAGFWIQDQTVYFQSTINPQRYYPENWDGYDWNLNTIFKACFPSIQIKKKGARYLYLSDKSAQLSVE